MKLILCFGKKLNFDDSLLKAEGFHNEAGYSKAFMAACAFDEEMHVMPVVSKFLSHELLIEKKSEATVKQEFTVLRIFATFLNEREELRKSNVQRSLIEAGRFELIQFVNHCEIEKNLRRKTIRGYDSLLRSFYNYLYLAEFISKNPYEDGYISKPSKTPNVESISIDELYELICCSEYERERLILQFLYDSGVRRSELPRVTLEDINRAESRTYNSIKEDDDYFLEDDYVPLLIKGSKSRTQGEYKTRYTRISLPTYNRIKRYHSSPLYKILRRKYSSDNVTPAFFNSHGKAFTPSAISKLIEKLSVRAIKKGKLTRKISPHKLRHGFAYSVLSSKDTGTKYLDRLVQVQLMLGHKNFETTQETYAKVPIEIHKHIKNADNEEITRALLMERLYNKTKLKIQMKDTK